MSLFRPMTLLGRTAQSLALAFVLFGLASTALLQYTLVLPHSKQSAGDLAALLVLVAQIWVELPPETRPDYEKELLQRHNLKVLKVEARHSAPSASHAYLAYLEAALSRQVNTAVPIHQHPDHPGWLWADFPMGGHIMRLGFVEERLQNRLLLILPFLVALGLLAAFTLSVLLVRRITLPLADMAEATHRIGSGDFSGVLPETGPRELAELARRINRMEARIDQLLQNRTVLLAGISHDLRTPLARMRLEMEMLDKGTNRDLVDGLRGDLEEMEKLIADALLLARGLGGSRPEDTDLTGLLHEIVHQLPGTVTSVEIRAEPGCRALLDRKALRRVLGNLLDNALAYGEGKPVTLTCYRFAGGGISIEVEDRGPGIPVDKREAVFHPFHRLEGSRNRETGGSGLGLAIVRQLCETNGWYISVQTAPAGGTLMSLDIPTAHGTA